MKQKVQCWIFRKSKTKLGEFECLLLKTTDARGAFWQPVTGGVEEGEAIQEAAIREVKEETGLDLKLKDVKYSFQFQSRFGYEAKEHVFTALLKSASTKIQLSAHEHQEYKWSSISSAEAEIKFEENKKALYKALELLLSEFL